MMSYLNLVTKYLSFHKKKTRLAIISVAVSVTLITGIFSMLDAFLQFEKLQVIHDYGNYHMVVKEASDDEVAAIKSRIDVKNSGRWKELSPVSINGTSCLMSAMDENFAGNFNIGVIKGRYPTERNHIMLEQWAIEKLSRDLTVGGTIRVSLPDNTEREFVLSGIYNDMGSLKAKGIPGVFVSKSLVDELVPAKHGVYFIEFKNGVNIINAEKEIKSTLNIADDRVGHNDHLLAVIGQSTHKAAVGLYIIGGILFLIVLIAGVVMIYNTFNISVMERVRQFGFLRCVGASQYQIEKLVRREGLYIALRAIPIGILAGLLMTFACSAILKFYNPGIFGLMPLFTFSISGIGAGIVIGFMTVFVATLLPAKKAARVSPMNAVTGSRELKISKTKKRGLLTKIFYAEIAMGLNNAIVKKKTLFLMSFSIAISIIMFLGFQVFVDFMFASLKTTKPYTPDISLKSEQGISHDVYKKLLALDGVKRAYGRMFGYVDATFNAARLTDEYIWSMGGIKLKDDGLFVPPEKSWLISYDKNQLNWAKTDLISGILDEKKMNEQGGVIAVAVNLRNNVTAMNVNLQLGDKIHIDTPIGTKELTVMGILRSVPFSDSRLNLTTFITTEKLFTELTGESIMKVIDIQLKSKNQEQTVEAIKSITGDTITFLDSRQKNAEINQAFLTMAVFIYGFVSVIAFISILNIINTMNTSVTTKIQYFGVMRAVGMSGEQLDRMVLVEAATYSATGCITGCILGIILQKVLITNLMSQFKVVWKFPSVQIILILVLTMLITAISVISPLKRVKSRGIA